MEVPVNTKGYGIYYQLGNDSVSKIMPGQFDSCELIRYYITEEHDNSIEVKESNRLTCNNIPEFPVQRQYSQPYSSARNKPVYCVWFPAPSL